MTVTHRKQFGARYHCDACRKDVSDISRINCAICIDLDLCVECFAQGIQLANHTNDHPYRVMDTLSFPVFEEHWCAEEEILLIEGLEKYGIGNWSDVSTHIGTKSVSHVEEHYYNVFVNSPNWPLPDSSLSFSPHLVPRKRPLPIPATNGTSTDGHKKSRPIGSQPCNHDVVGYMPGREEFEQDYGDNLDECCVKELVFDDLDAEDDKELKLLIMDIYNEKLRRKSERKRFIFDRGLQEYKTILTDEKKKTFEEKQLIAQYKVFARLMTPDDFNALIHGFTIEHQLKLRIERLQKYRAANIRTFDQANAYEIQKAGLRQHRPQTPVVLPPPPLPDLISLFRHIRSIQTPTPDLQEPPNHLVVKQEPSAQQLNAAGAPRKVPQPLDISQIEGVDLLLDAERVLCSTLRVPPRHYLNIKEQILTEAALRGGYLKRREARAIVKIDVNKTSKFFSFFVEMGWLASHPPTPQSST